MATQPKPDEEWCPPGLEELVKQREVRFAKGGGSGNGQLVYFHVKNADGKEILTAETTPDFCNCSPTSTVVNLPNGGYSVLTALSLNNPPVISAPPGTSIGYVDMRCALCTSEIVVRNRANKEVFKICMDPCTSCCGDSNFMMTTPERRVPFQVIKRTTRAFGETELKLIYPSGTDNMMKVLLFGATFFVDYFAQRQQDMS